MMDHHGHDEHHVNANALDDDRKCAWVRRSYPPPREGVKGERKSTRAQFPAGALLESQFVLKWFRYSGLDAGSSVMA
jgi:hypothetical protein